MGINQMSSMADVKLLCKSEGQAHRGPNKRTLSASNASRRTRYVTFKWEMLNSATAQKSSDEVCLVCSADTP